MNVQQKEPPHRAKAKVVPIKPKWWHAPFFKFAMHVASTTATVILITAAAFVLSLVAELLQAHGAPRFVVFVFHVLEYTVYFCDAVVVLWNVIRGIFHE